MDAEAALDFMPGLSELFWQWEKRFTIQHPLSIRFFIIIGKMSIVIRTQIGVLFAFMPW